MTPTLSTATSTPNTAWTTVLGGLIIPEITASAIFDPQCTAYHLTMLAATSDQIWLNEPLPLQKATLTSCYATAVVSSLLAMSTVELQPFNPLLGGCAGAGAGYSVALAGESGYVACCPTGYLLHTQPDAPATRPASGATCYSNMPTATTTVTVFNTNSQTYLQEYYDTTAQAYAHVVDGYPATATSTSAVNAAKTSSTSIAVIPSTSVAITKPSAVTSSKVTEKLSGGAIGGIIAGCVVAVIALLTVPFLTLRLRHQRCSSRPALATSNTDSEKNNHHEKSRPLLDTYGSETSGSTSTELGPGHPFELPAFPAELVGSSSPLELPASYYAPDERTRM